MNSLRTVRKSLTVVPRRQNLQDITITRTGKPIIRTQGGRSVNTGIGLIEFVLTAGVTGLLSEVLFGYSHFATTD
jgi:NADH dehydrogenase (ubiquinone) 1 alpha subcomplex subunit 9